MHTYIQQCIHTRIPTENQPCMIACIHTYIHIHTCTHTHIEAHTYIHTHIHIHAYVYIHTIHTYIHT